MQSIFQRAYRTFVLTAILAALAWAPSGCKKEVAKPTEAAGAPDQTATLQGVTVSFPAGWKSVPSPENKNLNLVAASQEDGWEPSFFLEVQPNPGAKALDELMSSTIEWLAARKTDFIVRNKQEIDHPAGFKYARIEYSNTSEGTNNVPLMQWSIVIPLPNNERLQIQAAAATSAWSKYQPQFEKIVDSLKIPK